MSEEPRFTRVDLFEMSGGVRVFWYPKGWHRGTVPATNHLNRDIELNTVITQTFTQAAGNQYNGNFMQMFHCSLFTSQVVDVEFC